MISKLWPLLIGFTIWSAAFVLIYSLQALGCEWGWDQSWHRTILISVILMTIALLAATLAAQLRHTEGEQSEVGKAGTILTATALPTALVVFAPTAFLSLCN